MQPHRHRRRSLRSLYALSGSAPMDTNPYDELAKYPKYRDKTHGTRSKERPNSRKRVLSQLQIEPHYTGAAHPNDIAAELSNAAAIERPEPYIPSPAVASAARQNKKLGHLNTGNQGLPGPNNPLRHLLQCFQESMRVQDASDDDPDDYGHDELAQPNRALLLLPK
jgi:hypothetical protein